MLNLKEIFNSFNHEKQQDFISYLEKRNKRKDAKNIQLTKHLITNTLTLKEICIQLYKSNNKVAFHALRKRLFQSIIDFTADESLKKENSIDMKLIKLILSARAFLQKEQYIIGYKILDKAEITAKEYQLFTILNEIYHSKIQYAYTSETINIDNLITKYKENDEQYQLESKLNIAYSKIRKSLNEIRFQNKNINLKNMIDDVLAKHHLNDFNSMSFKSLYQLIQITNISTSQNFQYWNIESFLIEIYQVLKYHKSKSKQVFYHIEVLYVIANTLFRNKKFNSSLQYLEQMHFYMQENNNKYYKDFNFKYHLLLGLNYNYSGNQENAIDLFNSLIHKKKLNTISQLDILLSLIVFYFQKGDLEKVHNLFTKLYHTDKWYIEKVGIEWVIKKNIVEILLQIDLANIDIVDSRILSFKRSYFEYLKEIQQEKVITFLKLVEKYYKSPEVITTKEFHDEIENSFEWLDRKKEDIFIMSFFAWLKAKMTKKNLYLITLDLVTVNKISNV